MDALSKRLDQAPVLGEDTDVIYLHSCDLNTQFDFTVPSLQFLRLNVVLRPIHFLSVLWWRGVSKLKLICYQLTGKLWIDLTAWDFYSLYRLSRKFKRKFSFLFVGKWNLFIMKLFFEEFNLLFFTAEHLACFEMQPRQRRFGAFSWGTFLLRGQGNLVFKRKFMYL